MADINRYVGARYVPVFADPVEWDNTRTYEPLTIVTRNGASYTSKQAVPVGTDIANTDYWVATGNYNAQVEAYRQEVQAFDTRITDNEDAITDLQSEDMTLNSGLTALRGRMDNYQDATNATFQEVHTRNQQQDTRIASSINSINSLETRVNNIASEIDVIESIIPPAQSQSVPYMSPAYIGDYESRYQSACVCKNGDLFYMFNATNYDNTGTLKIANIKTNAAPVDMLTYPEVGHANSCAYHASQNAIWLAPLRRYTSGSYSSDTTLIKYNLTTNGLQVASTSVIQMPASILAVSYDHVTGSLWAFSVGDTLEANHTVQHTVYRKQADSDTFDIIGVIEYNNPYLKTDTDSGFRVLPQDIAVKNNIAFFCFNDGSGYTFDLRDVLNNDSASPLACYRIGYISNSGIWQFGEVEGFEFDSDGALYQMRDCTLNITETDSHTGQNMNLRFSVVTSLAVGAKVQTDMSGDFGSYEIVNISPDVQGRFSLTGSQIRSLNSLLLRVVPPCKVNVYGTAVENHAVRIASDLNLNIGTNTYQIGHIFHVSGKLQIFIRSGGELIVNRIANENFIDAGTQATELLISNRGTITIRNNISHFYDFGYSCAKLVVIQYGTITTGRFIWGDLTISQRGFWLGNHQIAVWS